MFTKRKRQISILNLMTVAVVGAGFFYSFGAAFDSHFAAQDKMLCESAQVSGNVEWLDRCQTYYVTGNAGDIR